jgi:hypothetical protein
MKILRCCIEKKNGFLAASQYPNPTCVLYLPAQDLKELTNMVHYENFRASVLERNGGAQPAQAHMLA